jgi:protein Tex
MTTNLPVHNQIIAAQLNVRQSQVTAVAELLDAGNTLPFIARYRKEATGGLDEEQLRQVTELLAKLRTLDDRRQTILDSIEAQAKLTAELKQQILAALTLTALEDLYQPYKPKRRTRAGIAREKGLQPLADLILAQPRLRETAAQLAQKFISDSVPTVAEALAGARDIVAETISDHPEVRGRTREKALRWGLLLVAKIETAAAPAAVDPRRVYELYYAYEARVDRLRPHQVLAINRGEMEKVLRVRLDLPERDWQGVVTSVFRVDGRSPLRDQLTEAIADAGQRLLLPAIERDVRRALTEAAEAHAITIFAANLRGLLSQPPLTGQNVLGIDPGFRTGCKVAVVDGTGKLLATTTIYPHPPQKQAEAAQKSLAGLIKRFQVSLIAIGNGTASRETEQLVADLIRQQQTAGSLHYLMVNEAGASVYSASPLARAELPDLDVSLRGAVSIARRLQDPLAELVKIDPQSIGVGLYQHDVNQGQLAASLDGVVESVVNQVGVDANTASPALLRYVAGIGPKLAERIVAYRDQTGPFRSRRALLKVPSLGPKAFEQAAGFLRIGGGDEPLDASAIHPESYAIARTVLQRAGVTLNTAPASREEALNRWRAQRPLTELAAELGTGSPTLSDILEQLARPGRDPRADLPPPLLRSDVLAMEDLQPGMVLHGTVRNVVDFGAFVDIGVKQDGLLHRSQIPRDVLLSVGDVTAVTVLSVEPERGRISLGYGERG